MSSRKSISVVSASTLFHFTKGGIRTLNKILKGGFHPKYHKENYNNVLKKRNIYSNSLIPMVCFCDIPLTRISNHLENYGSYGIGLRKNWGINKKISSLIYVDKKFSSASHIKTSYEQITGLAKDYSEFKKNNQKAFTKLFTMLNSLKDEKKGTIINYLQEYVKEFSLNAPLDKISLDIDSIFGELLNIYKYVKPYRGKKKKIFYDEREWRYVPLDRGFPILTKGNFKKAKTLNSFLAKKAALNFSPFDVSYIIVKYDKEIPKMVDMIEKLPRRPYTVPMKKILSARIISTEQIRKDF